jgi:hypothetical protein
MKIMENKPENEIFRILYMEKEKQQKKQSLIKRKRFDLFYGLRECMNSNL